VVTDRELRNRRASAAFASDSPHNCEPSVPATKSCNESVLSDNVMSLNRVACSPEPLPSCGKIGICEFVARLRSSVTRVLIRVELPSGRFWRIHFPVDSWRKHRSVAGMGRTQCACFVSEFRC
jgi:hypothetical protein